jgi:glycosyltransferase involved in cell wall biosynthesis
MKVLFINSVCGIGSTGRICTDIAQQLEAEGNEVKIAYGRKGTVPKRFQKYAIRIGTDFDCKMHAIQTRLFDTHGFGSKRATKEFLKRAEEYKPDLLWLHNLHGYYINVEMLFDWIKKHPEMQVKWTLHDCWAFTGHCSYCSQLRRYPACFAMSSVSKNFERKRKAFTGVKNMTLITPSKWLADLTRQSFLKEYPVEVHYNTIDTSIFKPTPSDFRERYGLQDKIIVLGVANVWEDRKGLFDFYKLAEMLDDRYVIVLVGLSEKQIKNLPKNIKGIQRTNSPQELAAIYTAADVFVNPTYEDNYPTVNLESQACGTKVITYDTGGCIETLYTAESNAIPCGSCSEIVKLLRIGEGK